jgi:putative oxidoreductase
MDIIFLAGRIMFVLIFLISGVTAHLQRREETAAYAGKQGAPAPDVLVPLSGIVIIIGSLSVALGVLADLGALLLAGFAFSVAFFMHAFWRERNQQARENQLAHFMKNIAMAGAAIILFYLYNQLQGHAGFSLTDPFFSKG